MPTLGMITIDTSDVRRIAGWWAERLGGQVLLDAGEYFSIVGVPGWDVNLGFQLVPDATPGKNRIHLDLSWDEGQSREDGIAEWIAAGAVHLGQRGEDGFHWDTFVDPDGNEFCISAAH